MVNEDLEYLLTYGTPEQRSQAIVKVTRAKSIEAIPILLRTPIDENDDEMRELVTKATQYLVREFRSRDEDKIDAEIYNAVTHAINQYEREKRKNNSRGGGESESRVVAQASPLATFIFSLIFTIAGVGILLALASFELNGRDFAARSLSTMGVVVELIESDDSDGDSTYKPVVEFADPSGALYRVKAAYSSSPPRFSVGEMVEILYPTEAPQQGVFAVDNSVFSNPLTLILGALGVVFTVIGFVSLIAWALRGNKGKTQKTNARADKPKRTGGLPKEL